MSSKAQGLSLNTIIIATIVLIVLLLLVGLTTGFFGKWKPKFKGLTETSCAGKGGTPTDVKCVDPEQDAGSLYDDVKEGQKCCLKKCITELGGKCESTCLTARIEAGDWECKKFVMGSPLCCKS